MQIGRAIHQNECANKTDDGERVLYVSDGVYHVCISYRLIKNEGIN